MLWIVFPLFHQIITHLGEQQELSLPADRDPMLRDATSCLLAPFHNVFVAVSAYCNLLAILRQTETEAVGSCQKYSLRQTALAGAKADARRLRI
ncbi:hypothetical protein [Pararhizobium sp. PWRC1-1]|uniref:hypothetical protein n=1 Tax=Pararhizobium sp. PWRC1-1 TaxID=2804566 RepID=UPI003CE683B4